ncbi:hypothetical protein AAFF_G00351010 [Aldrovandia affinis]|uniref:Uncharacterized protein n=1 Tax=Aldrovandia affinis TaxID=143900 RepID=A0AAD7SIT6_9TELE|nr:hypothetical protein AAFF_G00351010 [Aldrovandia affinis]
MELLFPVNVVVGGGAAELLSPPQVVAGSTCDAIVLMELRGAADIPCRRTSYSPRPVTPWTFLRCSLQQRPIRPRLQRLRQPPAARQTSWSWAAHCL